MDIKSVYDIAGRAMAAQLVRLKLFPLAAHSVLIELA